MCTNSQDVDRFLTSLVHMLLEILHIQQIWWKLTVMIARHCVLEYTGFVTCAVIYFEERKLIVQSEVMGMSAHLFGRCSEHEWCNLLSFKGTSSVSPYWAAEDG
jgi:hypothetical protein